jgi:hypothetical protein
VGCRSAGPEIAEPDVTPLTTGAGAAGWFA